MKCVRVIFIAFGEDNVAQLNTAVDIPAYQIESSHFGLALPAGIAADKFWEDCLLMGLRDGG